MTDDTTCPTPPFDVTSPLATALRRLDRRLDDLATQDVPAAAAARREAEDLLANWMGLPPALAHGIGPLQRLAGSGLSPDGIAVGIAVLTAPAHPVRRQDLPAVPWLLSNIGGERPERARESVISRAIARLVKDGWLRREADPADRRQALLWPGPRVTGSA
ncbi:MarR family transcriptional regulator [Azospirillum argentinense]|uniref:MarR family transcriptional regulator n=1 Tax=Azospirillum brasilense TaxID=192 RepID=A0A4D8QEW6_AZOBR|nr:MarR family transcriptional regulator [Azospirillum argentinense]QCO07456.1 MarR family transcriptional regulator [Azospirillum argentinense]